MDTKSIFDRAADSYDQTRRKYVPHLEIFYGAAVERIPARDNLHILDLGAGTGLLSAMIAQARPSARITVTDISEDMLSRARTRFADRKDAFSFATLDYIADAIPGTYDVISSALSIHHTPHEDFASVIKKIHDALAPGGLFINADQALGETPEIERTYEEMWLRHAQAQGATPAEIQTAQDRMKADRTLPLTDQLTHLRAAGFTRITTWYQWYRFTVYTAQKSIAEIQTIRS